MVVVAWSLIEYLIGVLISGTAETDIMFPLMLMEDLFMYVSKYCF